MFVGSTGVLDELEQCATIGDLHHALAMLVLDAEPPLVEAPEHKRARGRGPRAAVDLLEA